MEKKNFKIEIKIKKRLGHNQHRSGAGQHDSRPKRLRTRNSVNNNAIKDQQWQINSGRSELDIHNLLKLM